MVRILVNYNFAPHTTANYMVKALRAEGHDVRTIGYSGDVSGWAEPYLIAGPHDYTLAGKPIRLHTLGDWQPEAVLWIETGHTNLSALAEIPKTVPLAGWFIDSHNPGKLKWHKQIAPAFDHVFVAMRDSLGAFPNGAQWLPLACDPDVHTPREVPEEPEYDLAWVGGDYRGSALYARRFRLMSELETTYRCRFEHGVYFRDMADVYGSARLVWNHSVTGHDLVMRVFEGMCSGRPLVTDVAPRSGLGDLFDETHLMAYWDEASMIGAIDALLEDADWAAQMGARGREAVLEAHTYRHRARCVVRALEGS